MCMKQGRESLEMGAEERYGLNVMPRLRKEEKNRTLKGKVRDKELVDRFTEGSGIFFISSGIAGL